VLAVVTAGIYGLFFWWRVSREADDLKGRRHAHGLAKTGILLAVLGGLVAAFAFVAALVQAVDRLGPDMAEDGLADALAEASPALLAVGFLALLAALAGVVVLYVAQYRSWDSIRAAEAAVGRADTVNPALYLFLPLGLNLLGSLVERASPELGLLASLATMALVVTFMALTQAHLNRLWSLGVAGPPPAPAAR
jgi:hypothetical protein